MVTLVLWQKIALYVLLLLGIYVFVRSSQLKINNKPILKLEYRILLAVLAPVLLLIGILIGSFIVAIALAVLLLISANAFFRKKSIKAKSFTIKLPYRNK